MWPHQSANYWSDHEREDPIVQSEPSITSSEISDEEDIVSYGSSDMDFVTISSMDPYEAVQHTGTARHLRCDCIEELTVQEQEMVIRNSLGPHHLTYYPSSLNTGPTLDRSIDEAPSSQQRTHNEEEIAESSVEIDSPDGFPRADSPFIFFTEEHNSLVRLFTARTGDLPSPNRLNDPMANRWRLRCLPGMPQPSLHAVQVANRVVNYARVIRNAYEKDVCCLDCGFIPHDPVTGQCGHTRCTKCIQDNGKCPCGNIPPQKLHVNVLLREIIERTTAVRYTRTMTSKCCKLAVGEEQMSSLALINFGSGLSGEWTRRSRTGPIRSRKHGVSSQFSCHQRTLMSPRARYDYAIELVAAKRYAEATPHLALAAASCLPELRVARSLLAQVITLLSKGGDPRRLNRQLNQSVRQLSSTSWIKLKDMECILCCDTFTSPVTTPCGHTFCRVCIERTLDYGKRCPLCLRSLEYFNLRETRETAFVQAALATMNAVTAPPPPEPDIIPIFLCTVAFPTVPCPLFIFDPRYWLMIRRVLESGSRKFGMVACDRDCRYASYGTVLEVRDCVHLEDGRSILSTVGISRFRVIDIFVRDGCEVARIMPIIDARPRDQTGAWDLKINATKVLLKSLLWLSRLDSKVLLDIETTFGSLPNADFDSEWWKTRDGPAWMWWLVAVLPLRTEIKVLILSTDCLLKRLLAVARTLEALDGVAFPASP